MSLDGNTPVAHNALILVQAAPCMLLVAQPLESPHRLTIPRVLVPDWHSLPTEIPNLPVSVMPDALNCDAVAILTFGTTEQSKGIRLSQRNLANLTASFVPSYQVTHQDALLPIISVTSASFAEEILPLLIASNTLVLAQKAQSLDSDAPITLLASQRVTILSTTSSLSTSPSVLAQPIGSLRLSLYGGEVLECEQIALLLPHVAVVNGYGLTESGTCSTYPSVAKRREQETRALPIGRPIQST